MEIEKTIEMNRLLDFYSTLLTTKQRTYIEHYYGDNYSLGEIADNYGVTRQAVYDNIKRTENILIRYEEKLKMVQQYQQRQHIATQITRYVAEHYANDRELAQLINTLIQMDDED